MHHGHTDRYAVAHLPQYDAAGSTITSWYATNSPAFLSGQFVSGLGFLLFYLPFLAGICALLRSAEGGHAIWSRVAFAGGILFPAAGTAGGILLTGLALLKGNVQPDVARLAITAGSYGISVSGALSGTLMGAASIVMFKTRVCPTWLAWLGTGVAITAIVGSAAVIETDPSGTLSTVGSFAWLGFFVWAIAFSVYLLLVLESEIRELGWVGDSFTV